MVTNRLQQEQYIQIQQFNVYKHLNIIYKFKKKKLYIFFYFVQYVLGQHDSNTNIQTVYTATTQTDFMRIVATKWF